MKSELPKLESKKCSERYKLLKEMIPHYTPEWAASDPNDAGIALLKIFSQMNENVINRLNQAPKKNFVAFLDMLGIKLLPAQPAKAPITFKLAKGTESELFIPKRTQVSAGKTAEHDELPFETEQELLATPSQLKAVVSVDPEKDAIYVPPPGFLDGKTQKQNKIAYSIVSSPSAGSDNFQLDNVTDLNPGDFLRIDDKNHEYVIISKISGMIIHITDHLLKDYPSGTPVEKITNFNLFEGKNMQEHSLYLGHKDLFNIKSTAQFTLFINHRAGAEGVLSPLKVSWEYWGEIKGEEGEEWQKFDIIDGTFGLSKEGTVILNKMTEGEIKEKEINGVKSRWIRCILTKPLEMNASIPVLDNVVFKLNSSGENLSPDQAFNNDIPIDLAKPFAPFGYEPRVFDNFSFTNSEVFSKKGAKIKINAVIEERGILGSPTAVSCEIPIATSTATTPRSKAATSKQKYKNVIKVFARGTSGRLVEVEIDPKDNEKEKWIDDHDFPPDTKIVIKSRPSAVAINDKFISVFATAENGHLVERYFNGIQWQWIDCGTPLKKGVNVVFDPASVIRDDGAISVFVTGSDGQLYEFVPTHDSTLGTWITHKPVDTPIDSSPYILLFHYSDPGIHIEVAAVQQVVRLKVFVKVKTGNLYELDWAGNETYEKWIDHGLPQTNPKIEVDSSPLAILLEEEVRVKVFVKGSDNTLWECDCNLECSNCNWGKAQTDPDVVPPFIDSELQGYVYRDDIHIFCKDIDNCLQEYHRRLNNGLRTWISHKRPTNSKLKHSPFALLIQNEILYVFSASDKNSIIEWIETRDVWNEYKDPDETSLSPLLSWEYWNNKGWVVIKGLKDGTSNLLKSGEITFNLPEDIEATEIAGQKNYWIRVRLVSGDYGKETFVLLQDPSNGKDKQQLISTKNKIRPPIVDSLKISYTYEASRYPDKTVAYNNLEYIDQTEASKMEDKFFSPFVKLEDKVKNLYLGFENYFKGGPIKIYFAAKELPFTEERKPKIEWTYSVKNEWNELDNQDDTEGLIKADVLELLMGLNFSAQSRFGSSSHWIKGSLKAGEYEEVPLLEGIYPNTTWASQVGTIKDEILGSSNGTVNQKFSFLNLPVLPSQDVRVNEMLSDEEKQSIISSLGEDSIKEVRDEKGKIIENWIQWSEVPDFFDSKRQDRHYTLDHATGQLQFGDGNNGMIPQALDNNIKAFSYQSGGGKQGNVKAGEIKSLKSTIAGVESVSNPVAADGGADAADLDQMLEIGPTMISHRDRAVTAGDFELLAKQASRKVVKVRCLPNTNNKGQKEIGWVTLVIVPDSKEDIPLPSLELRKEVQNYLETKCENTLTHKKHIHIDSPSYVKISVSADLFVTSIEKAFNVDNEVKRKLDAFFHPLTGRREQTGWEFGRDVADSDIYALIENIEGVDHVENLKVTKDLYKPLIPTSHVDNSYKQSAKNWNSLKSFAANADEAPVKFNENSLVANGTHNINIRLLSESDPYGAA